jgi:hypothetical protein
MGVGGYCNCVNKKYQGKKWSKWQNYSIRDRCYDFKNIFAEKFCDKIAIFDSKQSQTLK